VSVCDICGWDRETIEDPECGRNICHTCDGARQAHTVVLAPPEGAKMPRSAAIVLRVSAVDRADAIEAARMIACRRHPYGTRDEFAPLVVFTGWPKEAKP
jgi:hypothetical protein